VRLISWNVNGIRAAVRKGFFDWIEEASPDVLCLQETRIQSQQLTPRLRQPPGYHSHWFSAQRPGYSSVSTWSAEPPLSVQKGFGIDEFDAEGRVLITEHPGFTLFNVYFPNGKRDHGRLDYKLRFYADLLDYIAPLLDRGERVIVCGDANTAHRAVDLARPKQNTKTSGFLPEERVWLDRYFERGFVDVYRVLHPDAVERYTWWTYIGNARDRNVGWRIDYFWISENLMPAVTDADILADVMGSDHCPVTLDLDLARLEVC
jgi:exodeoxyribonuclease-3